jgi:CheY-like chemotaxis protein
MQTYVAMLQADEDDRVLTESILEEMKHRVPMHFINRITELKEMIAASGLPSIILINNNDHRHKAIDVVKHLKTDPVFSHIPVIVLGEITTPDYIKQYYRAGANTYITKPSTVAATQKKIRLFLEYWFDAAEI